ncbi:hypothetical protein C5615_32130 [Burkholderia cepacia]|uniref:DUF3597 domain-containing protein n=1 Tax=Burkholderia cepacia TaxID=292 RepID=A0A2S8I9H5_BURCE|nr:DUF3597 domain-containing protein [Burkholderia cepacia]PQP11436.1 hypothetical protein C5615_32130 [Burkholderia cepacia]HDR9511004.1 DUF3597 domain-containing protein [Burkholderia cepacia]
MGILGDIVNKIFGKAKPDETPPQNAAVLQNATAPNASRVESAPLANVDVAAIMDALVSESAQTLNWRASIVDMMKALGMDSSLDSRRQLARELQYSGDLGDSAAMNIWLHQQLMRALAANGGKLPPNLLS